MKAAPLTQTLSRCYLFAVLVAALGLVALPAYAQMGGMPDARSMSGIPRAVDDLPAGTLVVLLV